MSPFRRRGRGDDQRVEALEDQLKHARQRIRRLRNRLQNPYERWARQRDRLIEGTSDSLTPLVYHPPGNWNPFMRLLYSRCAEFGFDARPTSDIRDVAELPSSTVFHLHWNRSAYYGSTDAAEASQRVDEYLKPIEDFVGRGGTMLWTIHEVFPHDTVLPEVEARLRARLAELATGIHVLHESTLEAIGGRYPVDPAKVFVVEHPLYVGAYPDVVQRAEARAQLRLDDDTVALLLFGAIRHYKGFDRVIRLIPEVRERTSRDIRVLIAGRTLAREDQSGIIAAAEAADGVSIADDGPPDEAVPVLLRAADMTVLPYRDVLNSGALMLGLTYGVPTVAPRNPVTTDAEASGLVTLFDAASDEDLADAMVRTINSLGASSPPVTPEFAARHAPHHIAGEYAKHARRVAERD